MLDNYWGRRGLEKGERDLQNDEGEVVQKVKGRTTRKFTYADRLEVRVRRGRVEG
jgi:hypothetical protein